MARKAINDAEGYMGEGAPAYSPRERDAIDRVLAWAEAEVGTETETATAIEIPSRTVSGRVVARLRAEWPGVHIDRDGHPFEAPPVREGGATAALIDMAGKIAAEVAAE